MIGARKVARGTTNTANVLILPMIDYATHGFPGKHNFPPIHSCKSLLGNIWFFTSLLFSGRCQHRTIQYAI